MKYWFKAIFTTECWVINHKPNKVWDTFINECIDEGAEFKRNEGSSYGEVYGLKVWLGNYPYAYGLLEEGRMILGLRRRTVLRLHEYLNGGKMSAREKVEEKIRLAKTSHTLKNL